jgi:hypothetical protein
VSRTSLSILNLSGLLKSEANGPGKTRDFTGKSHNFLFLYLLGIRYVNPGIAVFSRRGCRARGGAGFPVGYPQSQLANHFLPASFLP